jgi:tetratricopeptide (TPR) repeat protein
MRSLSCLLPLLLALQACTPSADTYLKRGDTFLAQGKLEDAALNFRNAVQRNPQLGLPHLKLGIVALRQGRIPAALDEFTQAERLMPGNSEAMVHLADLCVAIFSSDPSRPVRFYEQVVRLSDALLKKDAQSYDGLRLKGYIHFWDRRPKEALRFFRHAHAARPSERETALMLVTLLFDTGSVQEGEAVANAALKNAPTFGSMYTLLYRQYVSAKRIEDARILLQRRIAATPDNLEAAMQLCTHYFTHGPRAYADPCLAEILKDSSKHPNAPLLVGDFYAGAGQLASARKVYQQAVQTAAPGSCEYQKRLIDLALREGNRKETESLLAEVLKLCPKDPDARRLLAVGKLTAEGAQRDAATKELNALVKENPQDTQARLALAQALTFQGREQDARAQLLEAVGSNPAFLDGWIALARLSLSTRRYQEAEQYVGNALQLAPLNELARILKSASLLGRGQTAPATRELEAFLRLRPNHPEATLQLAFVKLQAGQVDQAELLFRKLYRSGATDLRPLRGLAEVLLRRRRNSEALALIEKELTGSSNPDAVRVHLAEVAARTGQTDRAEQEYTLLAARHPNAGDFHLNLGHVRLQKGDLAGAESEFHKASQVAAAKATAERALGLVYFLREDKGGAIGHYRKGLAAEPANAILMNDLAFVLAESGQNLGEALQLIQRALKQVPGHPDFMDTLGWVYYKQGNTDSALQVFTNLTGQNPSNASYRYHLGAVMMAKGDRSQAAVELRKALDLRPAAVEAKQIQALLAK